MTGMYRKSASTGLSLRRRGVLAVGLGALASVGWTGKSFALGTFEMGDNTLFSVSDGGFSLPMVTAMPEAPQDELTALLAANGLPTDRLTPDCNVTILRRPDGVTVFDTGAGPNFMPTTGKLMENLAEAGVEPEEVTDVVFTHAHPDHLWGVLDDFDEIVFPNAAFHMGEKEMAFWASEDAYAAVPEDRQSFVAGAQTRFEALGERLQPISSGTKEIAGAEIVETFGHTPGHLSFIIHGGSDPYMIGGDAIMHAVISFEHPEWKNGSDQDPDMGAETRTALLDRLAADRVRLIGYHLPHPGQGRVERKDGGYRFVAG